MVAMVEACRLSPASQKILQLKGGWRLMKTTTKHLDIPLEERLAGLRGCQIPSLNDPATFADRLFLLEERLGTCHALLVGLLVACGHAQPEELCAGFTLFEQALSNVKAALDMETYTKLHPWTISGYVTKRVGFDSANSTGVNLDSRPANSTWVMLHQLAEQQSLTPIPHIISDCTTQAPLVALFTLGLGLPTAEARVYPSVHPLAVFDFPKQAYMFHWNGLYPDTRYFPPKTTEPGFAHPLSFVATHLAWQTNRCVVRHQGALSSEEIALVRLKLACAEGLNPFNEIIPETYRWLARLAGDVELENLEDARLKALEELGYNGFTCAVLPG